MCMSSTVSAHPQCRWQKDARRYSPNFHVNYQNQSDWSFPSVAHHVSSASGQAAAGVGQRADATVRFPWQQRKGSETRNVANTPSSRCSPTRCIAKASAVLRGGEGAGRVQMSLPFRLQSFQNKEMAIFLLNVVAKGKESHHAGLVFCV